MSLGRQRVGARSVVAATSAAAYLLKVMLPFILFSTSKAFYTPISLAGRLLGAGQEVIGRNAGPAFRRLGGLRASSKPAGTKRVVFLGTPDVAALTLSRLLAASKDGRGGGFDIVSVVTQPPAPSGRKLKLTPSPVQTLAESEKVPVLCPDKAKDPTFLSALETLAPDLCITAAYGNFLPSKFLAIPRYGTLNIHPSLLPKYRGASPVQRTLQAGDTVTGVSVLFTELKMDAGPLLAQVPYPLRGEEKAPELLQTLFTAGTEALLEALPSVWDGTARLVEQQEEQASQAEKIRAEEAQICFERESALRVHNKVRAFAGWPGTWATFEVAEEGEKEGEGKVVRLKIVTTRVGEGEEGVGAGRVVGVLGGKKGGLRVRCGDGSVLDILEVQPPGKKVMDCKSYANGLRGRSLRWRPKDAKEGAAAA